MPITRAMILAAGRGTRMGPLTERIPKPLLSVGGHPLIEYPLRALAAAGVTDVVINLSWRGGALREAIGTGGRFGMRIAYLDEGPEPLETGGGIRNALDLLGREPFWVANGDVYSDWSFPERALPDGRLAHLVLVENPEHNPAGDFALDGDRVRENGQPRLTYSGIALLHPRLFAGCPAGRYPLAPLLQAAAADGHVGGELHPGCWTDVGTPERLSALDRKLAASPTPSADPTR